MLPISLAWDAFLQKNGVSSLQELRSRVYRYRRDDGGLDPEIGCNVLVEPFFLDRSAWIPTPESWSRNIVQGKTYDTATPEGQELWEAVKGALYRDNSAPESAMVVDKVAEGAARYGEEYLTRGRLGQGAFRVLVTDAYQRRCAVTGERTLPVLDAAHIRPYAMAGPHKISNGILLRSDLHKLFDLGYITVTPERRLLVSSRLRADWQNGREYYAHHGQPLRFEPEAPASRPGAEFLEWHNEHCFKP